MNDTIDICFSGYTALNYKNGPFDGDYFIWSSKDILEGNSYIWHQKYYLPCTKVLGFVACRFTPQIIDIGASELSWGDVKTIKSGKISDISRDVSYK